jgi:hypothetical protein
MPVPDLTKPADGSAMVAAEVRTNFVATGTAVKVRASHNANVAVASGAVVLQPFNTETTDSDAHHDNAVNNSRFTVPAGFGGWYDVTVRVRFEGPAVPVGYRQLIVCLNAAGVFAAGAVVAQELVPAVATAATYTEFGLSTKVQLAAGDYLEVFLSHNQGAALNSVAAAGAVPTSPSFEMTRVGA